MSSVNNNWQSVPIGVMGAVITGKTPPKIDDQYWSDGDLLFISPKDLEFDSRFIEKTQNKVTEKAYLKFKNQVIPPNSIMFTSLSYGFGKIGIVEKNALTNQQINSIALNNEFDRDFIYYLLRNNKEYLLSFNNGIDTPIVPKSVFQKIELSVPNLSTQKRIGAFLSKFDELIENNSSRIQILEEIAQSLYEEWFVNFKFPGYEKVKMVDSNLGRIPEGWKVLKLGDLVKLSRGKNITKKKAKLGNVPVVGGGLKPSYYHNIPNVNSPAMTISASGANAGFVNLYHEDIWASDCSYMSSESNKYFYYFFINLKLRQKEIFAKQTGSAQPHLYPKDIYPLKVIYPKLEILEKYQNICSNIFDLIGNLNKKNNILIKARDVLLPRLISGEIKA